GRDDGPPAGDLVPDDLGVDPLPDGDELHLGGDLAPAGVVHLGHRAARRGPQPGPVGPGAGERLGGGAPGPVGGPALVAQRRHPAGAVLDVAALVEPPGADRLEAHPGVAARSARVVAPDRRARRVELDLEERDAHVVAPAGDVDLAADAHAVLPSPALPGSGSAVGASAPSQPGRPSSRVVLPATVAPLARARAGRGGAN